MKLYACSVKLADSLQHVVPNKVVTIPEIAVLRVVHGQEAVVDIRPHTLPEKDDKTGKVINVPQVKTTQDGDLWTDDMERQRLVEWYQHTQDGVQIDKLFGALSALPRSLREIGIDPKAAAAEMHRKAEELAASAARLAEEDDAPAEDEDSFFAEIDEKAA